MPFSGADEKAAVLIEALPYIRKLNGKTMVVKYGGNAMLNEDLKRDVILDVILLKYIGINPILVHGGGPEINEAMDRMGKKPQFVSGLRVTDEETMQIVQMVLIGKVNTELVSLINANGGKAAGLSGKDGDLIVASKRPAKIIRDPHTGQSTSVDLGFVGDIEQINPGILHLLTKNGYIPVVSSVGEGRDATSFNINADHVAGEIAKAVNADKLIMLTDIEGIFEDRSDRSTFISAMNLSRAKAMMDSGKIDGGMIPKLEACISAIEGGVPRAHIIDGRRPHSILLELFTDKGIGTMITLEG